ncbi:hypothetical protein H8D85_01405 [bacterium]|nr:hypothetical protein [bacterium]
MSNFTVLLDMLEEMDVPSERVVGLVDGKKIVHLRWLYRRLKIKNLLHPNYKGAIDLIEKEMKRC